MTITLKLKKSLDIPIEADAITPSHFVGKTIKEIEELEVYQGNRKYPLGNFFDISGEATEHIEDMTIRIQGDLQRVKLIGRRMNGGRIEIEGNVGMYLGAEMQAGRIHVKGSVGPWAAAEMRGGNIQIEGDAGDYLCAGFRGSREGMKGGRVYVAGNVGREMASHMRKGFVAVKGNVGELAAAWMQGGTIIVCGNVGPRVGVQATKGMLIVKGRLDTVLPTYRYSGTSEREFVTYYLRYLAEKRKDFIEKFDAAEKWIKFMGDFAEEQPRMEIYARSINNAHLIGGKNNGN